MASKIAAALLLQDLSHSHHLNIVPPAVKYELSNWHLAQETAQAYGLGDHEGEILFQFASLNSCTLVQHPVGLHYDSCGQQNNDKVYSLKNKIGFASKAYYRIYGMGRAGKGGLPGTDAKPLFKNTISIAMLIQSEPIKLPRPTVFPVPPAPAGGNQQQQQ
eukprot:jgi/Psemu1/15115/gm1.15115_g